MVAVESVQTQLDHSYHNGSEILGVEIDENQYLCSVYRAWKPQRVDSKQM